MTSAVALYEHSLEKDEIRKIIVAQRMRKRFTCNREKLATIASGNRKVRKCSKEPNLR